MSFAYVLPWIVWIAAFIALEVNGFRKKYDRWPTGSELVKRFEDVHDDLGSTIEKRGLVTWGWQRWTVALGLPVLAIVLELHWVWEVF
jgi:hypothetical protein